VRSLPADLVPERLAAALAGGWHLHPARMDYVPKGGGSHHWKVTGQDGLARFATVDDLDGKDWLGDTREAVFGGLGRALGTAAELRERAGLHFVVSPLPARDGGLLRRVGDRYAVSVFPFLPGRSLPFGPYLRALVRHDLVGAPAVRERRPLFAVPSLPAARSLRRTWPEIA
jgi:spectinomycin phosphotransferase